MKIIALQGSPRIGGNCDVLMDEMIKGAEENGHEVVKYYLEEEDIAGCKACMFVYVKTMVTRSSMNWLQQMV